jgi:uncharacterized lipoprotein YajG
MYKHLLILVTPFIFSGCAFTTDNIEVPYSPKSSFSVMLAGAEKVTIEVQNEDQRIIKDCVSKKKNGYGMDMAKIVAANDISQTFADAVAMELENLGFKIGEGGKIVKVDLHRFYNEFKMGFFSIDASADGHIDVSILDKHNRVLFKNSYKGTATDTVQLALGHNARAALIKVMTALVVQVATDAGFQKALLQK